MNVPAESVTVDDEAILITINKLFQSNMSERALYEATRGIWVLDPYRANKAKYAMAVFRALFVKSTALTNGVLLGHLRIRPEIRGVFQEGTYRQDGNFQVRSRRRRSVINISTNLLGKVIKTLFIMSMYLDNFLTFFYRSRLFF